MWHLAYFDTAFWCQRTFGGNEPFFEGKQSGRYCKDNGAARRRVVLGILRHLFGRCTAKNTTAVWKEREDGLQAIACWSRVRAFFCTSRCPQTPGRWWCCTSLRRSCEFLIRSGREGKFSILKQMRLPCYDSPTTQRRGCRAVTPWQPHFFVNSWAIHDDSCSCRVFP